MYTCGYRSSLLDDVATHIYKAECVRLTMLSCCVQSMLRYRTDLLRVLETLLFLPAFLSGAVEQKQVLEVELFSDYTDSPVSPALLWECFSLFGHIPKQPVFLPFFSPCTVCSLSYCCHRDSVQQGANLLVSALHSRSFHWCKVRVSGMVHTSAT